MVVTPAGDPCIIAVPYQGTQNLRAEEKDKNGVWGYPPARDEHLAVWCWARIPHWRMEGRDLGALRVVDCKAKPCEFCKEMAKFALKWEIIANSLENCNKSCTFVAVL